MKRLILVFLMLFTAVLGFSQSNLQTAATVNLLRTEQITVGQLRTEVERFERATGNSLTREQRREVLDAMINERLILQSAERARQTVSENEVNNQIAEIRNQMTQRVGRQPTDAEFHQAIRAQTGMDFSTYREQVHRQMIVNKYLMHRKGTMINAVQRPTEAEILSEYNIRRSELIRPDTIRFTMIQVSFGPDAASRGRARTLVDGLSREIGSDPSKFDEVVTRSVMPNSGFVAGDAGYLPRNDAARRVYGQAFMDTAFSLRQGQVSRVIEGLQGFHIIKITENHSGRQLELNDLFMLGTRVTVREYIGEFMWAERQQNIRIRAMDELVNELRGNNRSFTVFENNLNW
jgi:parvulin-like peptidyl-prolyl isomerase